MSFWKTILKYIKPHMQYDMLWTVILYLFVQVMQVYIDCTATLPEFFLAFINHPMLQKKKIITEHQGLTIGAKIINSNYGQFNGCGVLKFTLNKAQT